MKKLINVIFFLASICTLFSQALIFETTPTALTIEPNNSGTPIRIPFRNPGKNSVDIVSIECSCSCVIAEVEAKTCEPMGSGAILVRPNKYALGNPGTSEVKIRVLTSEGIDPYHIILPVKTIPEFTVSPQILYWDRDASDAQVEIHILINEKISSPRITLHSNPVKFKVALRKGLSDNHYIADVRPISTNSASGEIIEFKYVGLSGLPATIKAYAKVR
jgi:hypothetical protein